MAAMTFPIGYHDLRPDVRMNFQMNRFYGSVGEPDMLDEMRRAAPRIVSYNPIEQWYAQTRMLTNAHSITASVYGRRECAEPLPVGQPATGFQNHSQLAGPNASSRFPSDPND